MAGGGVVSHLVAANASIGVVPTGSDGPGPKKPSSVIATSPVGGGDPEGPHATGDLLSNQGCLQHAESAVLPNGVSCIDTARIYSSGRVHVHTQTPATMQVNLDDEPAIAGTGIGDEPPTWYADSQSDETTDRVYDFWTKPFDLEYGTTYYISAKAWDSDGNLSWRYGQVTTKTRVAHVTFEEIYITADADDSFGSFLNDGEIEFFLVVNDDWESAFHLPEKTLGNGNVDLPDDLRGSYMANDGLLRLTVQGVEHDRCGFNSYAPPPFTQGGGGDIGKCYDYATADLWVDLDGHKSGDTVYTYMNDYYLKFSITVRIDISYD